MSATFTAAQEDEGISLRLKNASTFQLYMETTLVKL